MSEPVPETVAPPPQAEAPSTPPTESTALTIYDGGSGGLLAERGETSDSFAIKEIPLYRIRLDGGTQTRASISEEVVEEYRIAMKAGAVFPPVDVFFDGSDYWPSDGFHRIHAAKRAYLVKIKAKVRQGTKRDAILFGAGSNSTHGLRRTNADKRHSVEMVLADPEWSTKKSNRWIAEKCGVSDVFVGKIREELSRANGLHLPVAVEGKDGKVYPRPEPTEPDLEISDELWNEMRHGEIPDYSAAKIAVLPLDQQHDAIVRAKEAIAKITDEEFKRGIEKIEHAMETFERGYALVREAYDELCVPDPEIAAKVSKAFGSMTAALNYFKDKRVPAFSSFKAKHTAPSPEPEPQPAMPPLPPEPAKA